MYRVPSFPHVFVIGGFGCCAICGLDKDDPDPTICEHDHAWSCDKCPSAHSRSNDE